MEFRRSIIAPDMQGFEFILPDIVIDGELFSQHATEAGGVTFKIYNVGPHHSFGDLVVHQVEDWKDTRLYGANQPANASFIYRELEEELF